MFKAILFDMDGVILDSVESNVWLFQRVFQEFGFAPPSEKELLEFSPRGSKETVNKFLPEFEKDNWELKQKMLERTRELSIGVLQKVKPMPEIHEILRELKQTRRLGLVTNRRESAHAAIELFGFQGIFDVVITAGDVENAKPHPEPIILALERLGVSPSEALFVGDMSVDLEAGTAAGVKTILIKNVDDIKKAVEVVE